jgi:hypothetical protein
MKKENHIALHSTSFIHEIKQIVTEARQKAYTAINSAMVEAYWLMGKRIVEEEQQGKERADYGNTTAKRTLDRTYARVREGVLSPQSLQLSTVLSNLSRNILYTVENIELVSLQALINSSQS